MTMSINISKNNKSDFVFLMSQTKSMETQSAKKFNDKFCIPSMNLVAVVKNKEEKDMPLLFIYEKTKNNTFYIFDKGRTFAKLTSAPVKKTFIEAKKKTVKTFKPENESDRGAGLKEKLTEMILEGMNINSNNEIYEVVTPAEASNLFSACIFLSSKIGRLLKADREDNYSLQG
ncbi:MAG: hypothetical protein DDT19_01031 [Syntrophomonadaceae bacterium]|nr:hypothetical protein [Bacillota bacterium]